MQYIISSKHNSGIICGLLLFYLQGKTHSKENGESTDGKVKKSKKSKKGNFTFYISSPKFLLNKVMFFIT